MSIFELLNLLCGVVIFLFSACRLGGKKWKNSSLEFWAIVFLMPSSIAIIADQMITPTALLFRTGVASYFLTRSWRMWKLKIRKNQLVTVPKPKINLILKKGKEKHAIRKYH